MAETEQFVPILLRKALVIAVLVMIVPIATRNAIAAGATAPPEVHYAPAENLERIDVALIDRAARTIDMAAYVLTDLPVIEALARAARRGVAVRILIDRAQHEERAPSEPFGALAATPGVAIRVKASRVYMHLKSYAVDGRWLRSGAANLSASGLKRQDNDLVLFDSPQLAAKFIHNFEAIFAAGVER